MTERPTTGPGDDALRRVYGAAMTGVAGPHLSEDDWVALASDEVSDDARAAFAEHIAQCAQCATTYRAVAEVRAGASAFDPAAPASGSAVGSWALGRWAGLAAAAVVVLAVATTVQRRDRPSPVADTTAAPPASAPTPAAGAPPVPAALPAPRAWAGMPDPPAVTLPASLALTARGASSDRDTFLTAFGTAIAPYRAGRYGEAATALEALTTRFGDVPEAWFYLGASRLLADRPAEAVPALERGAASDAVGAAATWLRVVALERAGRAEAATAALKASCAAATIAAHRAACATVAATP